MEVADAMAHGRDVSWCRRLTGPGRRPVRRRSRWRPAGHQRIRVDSSSRSADRGPRDRPTCSRRAHRGARGFDCVVAHEEHTVVACRVVVRRSATWCGKERGPTRRRERHRRSRASPRPRPVTSRPTVRSRDRRTHRRRAAGRRSTRLRRWSACSRSACGRSANSTAAVFQKRLGEGSAAQVERLHGHLSLRGSKLRHTH